MRASPIALGVLTWQPFIRRPRATVGAGLRIGHRAQDGSSKGPSPPFAIGAGAAVTAIPLQRSAPKARVTVGFAAVTRSTSTASKRNATPGFIRWAFRRFEPRLPHSNESAKVGGLGMRLLLSICLFLLVATACDQKKAPPPTPQPAVGVQPATMKGVNRTFEFVGRIKAVNQVDLRARVEGFLEELQFREGQDVKAGDLLYQIEKVQYQAAVDQAKANLASAQALVVNDQLQYDRQVQLSKDHPADPRREGCAVGGRPQFHRLRRIVEPGFLRDRDAAL
jgi:hypothetical protein